MKKIGLVLVALMVAIFLAGCQEWGFSFGKTIAESQFQPQEEVGPDSSLCGWAMGFDVILPGQPVVILKVQEPDPMFGSWTLVIRNNRGNFETGWMESSSIEFWDGKAPEPTGRPCPAPRRPTRTPEVNVLEDPN